MYDKTELVKKFEHDMSKRSRQMRAVLAIDQFFNVLLLNGSQDETMSSHIGRRKQKEIAGKWELFLCDKILSKFEYNHCKKSLGE
jgi:hypothetical protein